MNFLLNYNLMIITKILKEIFLNMNTLYKNVYIF